MGRSNGRGGRGVRARQPQRAVPAKVAHTDEGADEEEEEDDERGATVFVSVPVRISVANVERARRDHVQEAHEAQRAEDGDVEAGRDEVTAHGDANVGGASQRPPRR